MVTILFAVGGVVRDITLRTRVTRKSVVQVLQFATAGVVLQLLDIVLPLIHVAVVPSRSGYTISNFLGPANWLSLVCFLIMLAAAWFIRIVAKPPATAEDTNDEARFQHLVDLNRSGGDVSAGKIPFFGGKH
jgi:hypothetical protein